MNRYRILNKYRIFLIVFTLLGMLLFWMYSSGFIDLTIGFDMNAADIRPGNGPTVQKHLISQILTMDSFMDLIGYTTTIMPVLLFSTVVLFYTEKKGLFSFRYVRGESQKKVIISTIFSHALINAVTFYIVYILYLSIGYLLIGSKINIPRNAFDGIFGQGFGKNVYLYYLVQGIPSFFIGSFVYTAMSCAVGLYCKKAYQSIICMLSYFWAVNIILEFVRGYFLKQPLATIVGMFEPTYLYGFQGYIYWNPSVGLVFQIMSSLLIPIIITIVLIIKSLSKKEKLYE